MYSPPMVQGVFASYAATVLESTPKWKRPLTQIQMAHTRMRGVQVSIVEAAIHCVLFSLEYQAPETTSEFDIG